MEPPMNTEPQTAATEEACRHLEGLAEVSEHPVYLGSWLSFTLLGTFRCPRCGAHDTCPTSPDGHHRWDVTVSDLTFGCAHCAALLIFPPLTRSLT